MTVSYLASDTEDDAAATEDKSAVVKSMDKIFRRTSGKEIQTHVLVWGLNDKDQLGGPRGSKVSFAV
jgi:E3 ubiquitin-protein ligase HERC2